jgi:hypothetical protein
VNTALSDDSSLVNRSVAPVTFMCFCSHPFSLASGHLEDSDPPPVASLPPSLDLTTRSSPMENGWIMKLKLSDASQVRGLPLASRVSLGCFCPCFSLLLPCLSPLLLCFSPLLPCLSTLAYLDSHLCLAAAPLLSLMEHLFFHSSTA